MIRRRQRDGGKRKKVDGEARDRRRDMKHTGMERVKVGETAVKCSEGLSLTTKRRMTLYFG